MPGPVIRLCNSRGRVPVLGIAGDGGLEAVGITEVPAAALKISCPMSCARSSACARFCSRAFSGHSGAASTVDGSSMLWLTSASTDMSSSSGAGGGLTGAQGSRSIAKVVGTEGSDFRNGVVEPGSGTSSYGGVKGGLNGSNRSAFGL